jgi:hypothetical protein
MPLDGLAETKIFDRTFEHNFQGKLICRVASRSRRAASRFQGQATLLLASPYSYSLRMASSARSRHNSRAFHDPGYEERVQAAVNGVRSGKYKNLRVASQAEKVSA